MFFENEDEQKAPSPAEQEYRNFLDDLREVTQAPAGKRVFWKLLEYTDVHGSSFDTNPQVMSFNEGRRDVGLWIEKQLEQIEPDLIYQIAKEKINVRSDR
jgi:hypothetical protein|nr:MAG TPA: hypothetical protein [Caudoviricetes sp.]